jgi:multidrug transporter EmrE-like cation transporter
MKTAVFLMVSVLAQAVGNTCLSKGMKTIAASAESVDTFTLGLLVEAMGTPLIWLGIVCLIVFFGFFAALLSWADLSFVLPASSFGYILNVAFAHHFLGEPVPPVRWAGTLLIVLGVVLVSRSAARREQAQSGPKSMPDTMGGR